MNTDLFISFTPSFNKYVGFEGIEAKYFVVHIHFNTNKTSKYWLLHNNSIIINVNTDFLHNNSKSMQCLKVYNQNIYVTLTLLTQNITTHQCKHWPFY